ncbi:hypothetical protein [Glaciecola sp. SC05]|uniref:hypothetical protein n=1 Tax=Glaciecola sp. SC05 TaxID=1987355 RepID=UPI0035280D61
MEVNFPKHRKVGNTFVLFFAVGFLVLAISLALGQKIWLSALLSIFSMVVFFYLKVIRHRGKHAKFLDSFGTSISNSTFYQKEYAIGAVPFSNRFMSCCSRIEGNQLFFGRPKHYRALDLEKIHRIEILKCLGHDIAKLEVQSYKHEHTLYIPWSPLLADKVDFEIGT